eukprot:scaffold126798_cov51-Phaeocystis_antarctica.AAC.4
MPASRGAVEASDLTSPLRFGRHAPRHARWERRSARQHLADGGRRKRRQQRAGRAAPKVGGQHAPWHAALSATRGLARTARAPPVDAAHAGGLLALQGGSGPLCRGVDKLALSGGIGDRIRRRQRRHLGRGSCHPRLCRSQLRVRTPRRQAGVARATLLTGIRPPLKLKQARIAAVAVAGVESIAEVEHRRLGQVRPDAPTSVLIREDLQLSKRGIHTVRAKAARHPDAEVHQRCLDVLLLRARVGVTTGDIGGGAYTVDGATPLAPANPP